jgi:hypothetical protein
MHFNYFILIEYSKISFHFTIYLIFDGLSIIFVFQKYLSLNYLNSNLVIVSYHFQNNQYFIDFIRNNCSQIICNSIFYLHPNTDYLDFL